MCSPEYYATVFVAPESNTIASDAATTKEEEDTEQEMEVVA